MMASTTSRHATGRRAFMSMILITASPVWAAGIERWANAPYEPAAPTAPIQATNVLAGAKASASSQTNGHEAALAVDGHHHNPDAFWSTDQLPADLTLALDRAEPINSVRLWTHWGEGLAYPCAVQTSVDGQEWHTVADADPSSEESTSAGELFCFPTREARFVRIGFAASQGKRTQNARVVEVAAYRLPDEQIAGRLAWTLSTPGLHGNWGNVDERYPRHEPPKLNEKPTRWTGLAWRGERLSAQLVLWTAGGAGQVRCEAAPLRNDQGDELPGNCVQPRFVRYVLADGLLQPDVLDDAEQLDMPPRSVRPIWVSIDVPASAKAGQYAGTLTVRAQGGIALPFEMTVEVLPAVLPPPAKWSFHLDLWQNPWAAARYHNVKLWSPEHWTVMEPPMRLLASAGQKCITTTLIDRPWGKQTYDPYGSMVEWIRSRDGSWRFDYAVFDRYVEFCQRCGITEQISCYSMVPWGNQFRYRDEATGDDMVLEAKPGTPEYEAHWTPFLKDFVEHLQEKGWLDRTAIAMDERPLEPMQKLIAFLRKAAPELKIALAGNYHAEIKDDVHDYCIYIERPPTVEQIAERVAKSKPTTFYVCCGPIRPNTFPFSPPAEAAWMGWHAAAMGYTGFLRWAYDSWTADPLYDTNHVRWPASDCFVAYPGGRSSIRFERLREGIQDFEKIGRLRAFCSSGSSDDHKRLWDQFRTALEPLKRWEAKTPFTENVRAGKQALDALSRRMAGGLAQRKPE